MDDTGPVVSLLPPDMRQYAGNLADAEEIRLRTGRLPACLSHGTEQPIPGSRSVTAADLEGVLEEPQELPSIPPKQASETVSSLSGVGCAWVSAVPLSQKRTGPRESESFPPCPSAFRGRFVGAVRGYTADSPLQVFRIRLFCLRPAAGRLPAYGSLYGCCRIPA